MTPPKLDKVDIQALDVLHLEHLLKLTPDEAAPRFKGTDLFIEKSVDPITGETVGELKRIVDGKGTQEASSIQEEQAWIQTIRAGDSNGDKSLDRDEAQALIKANLVEEQAASVDPDKFLESIEGLMSRRYRPLADNMRAFKSELAFRPIVDLLKQYNYGIMVDEVRQAHSVISFNSLTKSAVNAAAFVPYGIQRLWGDAPVLQGDVLAEEAARANYAERAKAIDALSQVVTEAVARGEVWALEGRIDEALKKLDAATVAILDEELAATRFYDILKLSDRKEAYQRLDVFAKAERPGFLGFGGGNTSAGWLSSFWNYTGRRNNLYMARTLLGFLVHKTSTGDTNFDSALKQEARDALKDMDGDSLGGFNNMVSVGLTFIISAGGLFFEPTEWRPWSDEAEMAMVGQMVNGAFTVGFGGKAFGSLSDAFHLTKMKGMGEVFKVWWGEGSLLARVNPFGKAGFIRKVVPLGVWKEARLAAQKEADEFAKLSDEIAIPKGRIGRLLHGMESSLKNFLFKDLPALNPAQAAQLKKAAGLAHKGMDGLTKGVLGLAIMQIADENLAPAFNPFEYDLKDMDREADFEAYPDPTRSDPSLVPSTMPQ